MKHSVDIIMIVYMGITLVVLVLTMIFCKTNKNRYYHKYDDEKHRIEIAYLTKLRNTWLTTSAVFTIAYYWCILFSFLATIIVIYTSCFEIISGTEKFTIILYSALSLFTAICPYVVNFKKLSAKYRASFILIEERLLSESDFMGVVAQGEKLIESSFEDC